MKRTLITLWLLAISASLLLAQQVKVIDLTDLQPVPDVFIFCSSHAVLTNEKGVANLRIFTRGDTLTFQHPSYKKQRLTLDEINLQKGIVKLEENLVKVSEIVVSASKWEQNKTEIPNKIEAIRAKEISFYNPQTTADLLSISDQVFIQKSQLGGGSPMIRGFAANRVLIIVDGVRMNNAIFRSGNLQNVIVLDPHLMDNSEIVFGPGSMIYGSDAIGGVMDFHSRKVKLSTSDHPYPKLNALTRFSSANFEKTGHLDFSYGTRKWGFLSSISFSDYDNLRMGTHGHPEYERPFYVSTFNGVDSIIRNPDPNRQIQSGYSQINMTQKFRFRPGDHFNLTYALHYSTTSDIPRYDRLYQIKNGKPKYGEWYYGPQKWIFHRLGAEITDTTRFFDRLSITLAYQDYNESRHNRKLNEEWIKDRNECLDIFSINVDANKKFKGTEQEIFYGTELITNRVFSIGVSRNIISGELKPASSRYPDGGSFYGMAGLYGGYKNRVSDYLDLITGLRASFIHLDAKFADKTFYDFPFDEIRINHGALNGSAGLVYHPFTNLRLNMNLSTGFRAPNVDDVGKVFDSEPGRVIVPNEGLKPEYVANADLGLVWKAHDRFRLEITGFYSWLWNAMVRRPFLFNGQDSILYEGELSQVEALVNADRAWVYGVTSSLQWNIYDGLSLKSSLTATRGHDSDGMPIRHAAPLFGATHIIYRASKIRLDLYSRYNGEKPYEQMPPSEIAKPYMYAVDESGRPYSPGWITLNFAGTYQIRPFIQLNTGVENILDIRYRPYSSGIAAPGRNIFLALRVTI